MWDFLIATKWNVISDYLSILSFSDKPNACKELDFSSLGTPRLAENVLHPEGVLISKVMKSKIIRIKFSENPLNLNERKLQTENWNTISSLDDTWIF